MNFVPHPAALDHQHLLEAAQHTAPEERNHGEPRRDAERPSGSPRRDTATSASANASATSVRGSSANASSIRTMRCTWALPARPAAPRARFADLPREEERLDPLHAQLDGELAVVVEHVRHVTRNNLALRHFHPPRRPDDPGGLFIREAAHSAEKRGPALPKGGENEGFLCVLVGGKGHDALPVGPAAVFPE